MRKQRYVLGFSLVFIAVALSSWMTNKARLTPAKAYDEVKIGDQIWMTKNLNVVTFRNGDSIPEAKTVEEWKAKLAKEEPAWCYFNNDASNDSTFGKFYNYYAINDPRGLAPRSWKIPSWSDFDVLIKHLGGKRVAGEKLKSAQGWKKNGNGSNVSGFNAVPSGCRGLSMITTNNGFSSEGSICTWWTSTRVKRSFEIIAFSIDYKSDKVTTLWETWISDGYAVRCVKE